MSSTRMPVRCLPLLLSVVCQFILPFAHAHAQYTSLFYKILMCSAVHREASIHFMIASPARTSILDQMQMVQQPHQHLCMFLNPPCHYYLCPIINYLVIKKPYHAHPVMNL